MIHFIFVEMSFLLGVLVYHSILVSNLLLSMKGRRVYCYPSYSNMPQSPVLCTSDSKSLLQVVSEARANFPLNFLFSSILYFSVLSRPFLNDF